MPRFIGAAAPEIDEQSYGEISQADQILPADGDASDRLAHNNRRGNVDDLSRLVAGPAHHIGGFCPSSDIGQAARHVAGVRYWPRLNGFQDVVGANARPVGWPIR